MVNVYVPEYIAGAGAWIYSGYSKAWESLGYNVINYHDLSSLRWSSGFIMCPDANIRNIGDLEIIKRFDRAFIYCQSNTFPSPWGQHPNWVTSCDPRIIEELNNLETAKLWSFSNASSIYTLWKDVNYVPLAFDSISYADIEYDEDYAFDICFVGSIANNGFNEKAQIMGEYFSELYHRGINIAGISVQKDISHQQEAKMLRSSKIALNIHDAYQQKLGYDVNERTFKSLGLNGILVSDYVEEVGRLFPGVPMGTTPSEYADIIESMLNEDLSLERERNRSLIMENHTYIKRVQELLS